MPPAIVRPEGGIVVAHADAPLRDDELLLHVPCGETWTAAEARR
jgi:hypothetical protein